MDLYQKHRENRTCANANELSEVLCLEVRQFMKVFILIDAMDEFRGTTNNTSPLLIQLCRIMEQGTTRLMVTSRPSVQGSLPNMTRMEIRAHDEDVRTYLSYRITKDFLTECRVSLGEGLRDQVVDTLARKAQGM